MTLYRLRDQQMQPFRSTALETHYQERDLETWLERSPGVVTDGEPILIIARQPAAGAAGTPDLIGLDQDGNTIVIELKRGRPPRDVLAQALEYAAWLGDLPRADLVQLAEAYLRKHHPTVTLAAAYQAAFSVEEACGDPLPVTLNVRQRIIVVVEGADERLAAVAAYLRRLGVDLTLLEYRYYRVDSGEEILDVEVRVGPDETSGSSATRGPQSEAAVLEQWPPDGREPFLAFRNLLLSGDEQIAMQIMKHSFSFYKRGRDGRVFIGGYDYYGEGPGYWMRRDSLGTHIDVDDLLAALRPLLPPRVTLNDQYANDFYLRFPSQVETARAVARLVLEHVAGRIA